MQSKQEYLLGIGLHNWLYRKDNLYTYPYTKNDILILQQIECKNGILKIYFKCIETVKIKNKKDYKQYIMKLRQNLKDKFDIWPNKYDKHYNKNIMDIIDIMMYKLSNEQLENIYALLRIEGYLSNKDEEQAFDFTL